MSDLGFGMVEDGMSAAARRAAVLASDAANALTPGFVPSDVVVGIEPTEDGIRFVSAVAQAQSGGMASDIERVMAATADNSIRFRSLADQERAMLHEYREVAEDQRR
jgi:flagellar basal body rod protein FlgB